jgi:hypothetical protein
MSKFDDTVEQYGKYRQALKDERAKLAALRLAEAPAMEALAAVREAISKSVGAVGRAKRALSACADGIPALLHSEVAGYCGGNGDSEGVAADAAPG